MNTRKSGNAVEAFAYSLAVTILLSVVLVIIKEKNEAVMAMMKSMTGHHWITHGLIVVTLFALLGLVLATFMPERSEASDFNRAAAAILIATFISGLTLAAFYLFWG